MAAAGPLVGTKRLGCPRPGFMFPIHWCPRLLCPPKAVFLELLPYNMAVPNIWTPYQPRLSNGESHLASRPIYRRPCRASMLDGLLVGMAESLTTTQPHSYTASRWSMLMVRGKHGPSNTWDDVKKNNRPLSYPKKKGRGHHRFFGDCGSNGIFVRWVYIYSPSSE